MGQYWPITGIVVGLYVINIKKNTALLSFMSVNVHNSSVKYFASVAHAMFDNLIEGIIVKKLMCSGQYQILELFLLQYQLQIFHISQDLQHIQ